MGSVVGVGTLIIEHATGKPLSWCWFVVLIVSGLAWHFRSEYENEKAKAHLSEYPKPFLEYIEERNIHSDRSEFFVQVEGDRNAFDVEISSQAVVGERHKRLAMQWEVPKGPISKTPVPVKAWCIQYERDIPHPAGGIISPGQIKTFFERKKGFDNKLEVTITFKDVDGRKCPSKKFIISSYRDTRGHILIGISPVEN